MDAIKAREIWRSAGTQDLSSQRRLSVVSHWLSECQRNHQACRSAAPQNAGGQHLPTRVIDLESNPIRLYEPSLAEVAPYAALSYCWGDKSAGNANVETTLATIDSRKTSLFLADEEVPATIQDAMDVTKSLGIRYLWVDALCIVQHDKADWEREAARMQSVYQNAEITLSATESIGCSRGFFSRSTTACEPFEKACFMDQHQYGSGRVFACLETVKSDIQHSLSDSPLGDRGWTFQESRLSRRLVHFTKKQLIWECVCKVATEDGILSWDAEPNPWQLGSPSVISDTRIYQGWEVMVKDYSRRRFSSMQDRVYALAGVISRFQDVYKDEPLAGLWRKDLAAGLLWFVQKPSEGPVLPELSDVPSWSWMSVRGQVQYGSIQRDHTTRTHLEAIEPGQDPVITWSGTPLTSKIDSAVLHLRGPVTPFQTLAGERSFRFWMDRQGEAPTSALLVLRSRRVIYRGGDRDFAKASQGILFDSYFLLLSPLCQATRYRRVGVGMIVATLRSSCEELTRSARTAPCELVVLL